MRLELRGRPSRDVPLVPSVYRDIRVLFLAASAQERNAERSTVVWWKACSSCTCLCDIGRSQRRYEE